MKKANGLKVKGWRNIFKGISSKRRRKLTTIQRGFLGLLKGQAKNSLGGTVMGAFGRVTEKNKKMRTFKKGTARGKKTTLKYPMKKPD